jgi:hypothetical protein
MKLMLYYEMAKKKKKKTGEILQQRLEAPWAKRHLSEQTLLVKSKENHHDGNMMLQLGPI